MTFYDASANTYQKLIPPPKGHFFEKIVDSENILQNVFPKQSFRRRKMKSCKSAETRFAKVSRRSEICLAVERPFEVSKSIEIRELTFDRKQPHGPRVHGSVHFLFVKMVPIKVAIAISIAIGFVFLLVYFSEGGRLGPLGTGPPQKNKRREKQSQCQWKWQWQL